MKKGLVYRSTFVLILLVAFVLGFGQLSVTNAAANIKFDTTEVNTPGEGLEVHGIFTNFGNDGATVTGVALDVRVTDANGNPIFADSCNFPDVDIWVPARGQTPWTFFIHNVNCPAYQGEIKWQAQNQIFYE